MPAGGCSVVVRRALLLVPFASVCRDVGLLIPDHDDPAPGRAILGEHTPLLGQRLHVWKPH